jgi:hypothetical protein
MAMLFFFNEESNIFLQLGFRINFYFNDAASNSKFVTLLRLQTIPGFFISYQLYSKAEQG